MKNGADNALKLGESQRDVLLSLARQEPVKSIAKTTGVSKRAIEGVLRSVKILVEANDGAVDDFLNLVENWDQNGQSLFFSEIPDGERLQDGYLLKEEQAEFAAELGLKKKKQAIIDEIEADWSPFEMRELGASLIRLADALDQDWAPGNVQSSFHWPSVAAQIERNSLELAKRATVIKQQIKMRKQFLSDANLGEPTWNMLLELFCQFAGGAQESTKSLCVAADCPESTALRHIAELEDQGMIKRSRSVTDRRVTMVELTKKGVVSVGRVLERTTA